MLKLAICTALYLLCVLTTGEAQRLPRPGGILVTERTESSCVLSWNNPRQLKYATFRVLITPYASVEYPDDRSATEAYITEMRPGVTYSVRLKGLTATKRSSTPTAFAVWSVPTAPTGLTVKTLEGIRLKISLSVESQEYTAKIAGAQIEWTTVKLDNALLGYETELQPREGSIVYPDDQPNKDSVLIYTGLTPGREYTVKLRTKIGPPYNLVYSEPTTTTFIMPPASPYDVKVNALGGSYVTLSTIQIFGEGGDMEFDIVPNHGKVGDAIPDPVIGAYMLYTVTKLMPLTDYVVHAYAVSHGVRSSQAFTVYFTTESSGQMDVAVSAFTDTTVTLAIEERKEIFQEPQELVVQYTNIDDPDSFLETEMFLYDSQSENSLVNVQILGLTPGVTYRFGVVKSPTSDFPEYVGEQIQTTIPEKPVFMTLDNFQEGVQVNYALPTEGVCPSLKVYTSPGSKRNNYRVESVLYPVGETIYLPGVPRSERYTIHARCVSSGVEGEEVVKDSYAEKEVQMDDATTKPGLACMEARKTDPALAAQFPAGGPKRNFPDQETANHNACCGPRPYRTSMQSCCGDYLIDLNASPKKLCCGSSPYISSQKKCCDDTRLVARSIGCDA